jgi:hypothetical protein
MPMLDKVFGVLEPANEALALQAEHLEGFRTSQALAYSAVEAVERQLHGGMTERDAAHAIEDELKSQGVTEYFHRGFAWFGERTAFAGFKRGDQFLPTRKRLEEGMPVILDVAPIVDGHAADIGYSCRLGDNPLQDQMLADLAPYRTLILEGVRARKNLDVIYREVDRLIEQQGYHNRHQAYPFRVLGHRVNYVPPAARTGLKLSAFGVPALSYLFGRLAKSRRDPAHDSPFWNDGPRCRHPAEPGLWAVEPHLGFCGVGVKWEELLVVTEDGAYWLDDDLPHVRRFEHLAAARLSSGARGQA